MTRNKNSKRTNSPSHSTITDTSSNDGNFINLPDLSGLKDDEKQHILNVLLRDEHLRNKHLTRFMYVHKNNIHIYINNQQISYYYLGN
jgi:hypothetical protein